MANYEEEATVGVKVSGFVEKNKKVLLTVCIILLAAIAGYSIFSAVTTKSAEKILSEVDAITYELVKESSALDEVEIKARKETALNALEPLLAKGGVGGVRANMLAADIAFQNEDYENALTYYTNAANKGKKSYTAALAYFNMGVCCENLGKIDEAAVNYKAAADDKDFVLRAHAGFSYGRVLETAEKYTEAVAAYNALFDEMPEDSWAKLAKTRLIDLKLQGKIE